MPKSAVEGFDLCGEDLSCAMLGVWNEVLTGLRQVRTIAHCGQVLELLLKDLTCFDRTSSTDKAEDLAKDGVYCKPL